MNQADVTSILEKASAGDSSAMDRLFPVVYDELHRLARNRMRRERPDHTLQATALVHEAYLRIVDQTQVQWQNRAHFFAVAAQAMRRILIDHARARGSEKRGGGYRRIPWEEVLTVADAESSVGLLELDAALTRLGELDPAKSRVVEMRFFAGLTTKETAEVLGIGVRTAERHWNYARAWLYRELADSGGASG